MSDSVLVDVDDGLMTITINRPEVRNAVNREVSYAVCAAVDELDANDALRVGILTGAGGTFCAGMDLKAFAAGEVTRVEGRGILGLARTPTVKPLIAAVEGYAVGGGFESALVCDLIVAARDARLGLPESRLGLAAMAGGLIRLPRLIPPRIAMEMALTGELVGATFLHHHGLINRLTEPGEALAEATRLARTIIGNAPLSVDVSKRIIVGQRDWTDAESFDRQEEISGHLLASEDAHEGATAFKEKRAPIWKGR